MKKKLINYKIKWFLADIVETITIQGMKTQSIWINTYLIRADTPAIAYQKAIVIGNSLNIKFNNSRGQTVKYKFIGLHDILPIYEPLKDGAEIAFEEYKIINPSSINKFITPRNELTVFKDYKAVSCIVK